MSVRSDNGGGKRRLVGMASKFSRNDRWQVEMLSRYAYQSDWGISRRDMAAGFDIPLRRRSLTAARMGTRRSRRGDPLDGFACLSDFRGAGQKK
jgi:hypothetical protein